MKTYKIVGGLVELIGQFFFININRGNVSIILKHCLYLYLTAVNHHWIEKINLTFIKKGRYVQNDYIFSIIFIMLQYLMYD